MKTGEARPALKTMVMPILLSVVGFGLVIYSVPGQGRNLTNALGIVLVMSGVVWSRRIRSRKAVEHSYETSD